MSITRAKDVPFVEKKWGGEIIFANNDQYCGKVLRFTQGEKFSMHYHRFKHETWYVAKGKLLFRWIDPTNASRGETELNVGDSVSMPQCQPHQLVALEDSDVFEVSTQHFDDDSYRVEPGSSQS